MSDQATTQPIDFGRCYVADARAAGLHGSVPISKEGEKLLRSLGISRRRIDGQSNG